MNTVWIRLVYGAVVAVLLAGSALLGIQLVSAGPRPPAVPDVSVRQLLDQAADTSGNGSDTSGSSQQQLVQATTRFFDDAASYRAALPTYRRNVVLAAISIGVVLVLIGLALPAVVNHVRWGFVLGSLLLFGYAGFIGTRATPDVPIGGTFPVSLLAAGQPGPLDLTSRTLLFAECFIGLVLMLFFGLWRLTAWPPAPRQPGATGGRQGAPVYVQAPPASAAPPVADPPGAWQPAPRAPVSAETPPPPGEAGEPAEPVVAATPDR